MILLVIGAFLGMALLELPPLMRRGYWLEVGAFAVFWVLGFGGSVWVALGYPYPFLTVKLGDFLLQLFGR